MKTSNKLTGKLSVSRVTSSHRPHFIALELTDDASGCVVIKVEIDMVEYGNIVSGLSYRPCEFEFNDSGVIGKRVEHKREKVYIPDKLPYDSTKRLAILKQHSTQFETDGWKAQLSSTMRIVDDVDDHGTYVYVPFIRYVDAKKEML